MPKTPEHSRVLGENIRARRKQTGFSQEKLAEQADLHPVYVGNVERGEENISIDSLARIAHALNVSISDLVNGL